ncbi:MAG: hypothetical protein ACO1SX_29210 [Actinomycetota bacterium]
MTIDEVLELADGTEACWIVWNMETGEILSCVGTRRGPDPQGLAAHLQRLSEYQVPVKARYFDSANVTRPVLERERDDTQRVKIRKQVLTAWAEAPVEELIEILERGEYSSPMSLDYDSRVILEHLWELHRDELHAEQLLRLRALVGGPVLGEDASRALNAYLFAFAGDHAALRAIWRREQPGRTCYADVFILMDCFAYLRSTDSQIISDLVNQVEQPGMFSPRREAMLALGKLGSVSGPRAAQVIRKAIYDSEPSIIAERERVLQRIETPDAEWVRCGPCCYGRVHRPGSHGTLNCPDCLGLGYLPG